MHGGRWSQATFIRLENRNIIINVTLRFNDDNIYENRDVTIRYTPGVFLSSYTDDEVL